MAKDPVKDAATRAVTRAVAAAVAEIGYSVAVSNQTLTGNRTVDDGDNGYTLTFEMSDGTNTGALVISRDGVSMSFAGASDLQLDGDAGGAGECLTSQGPKAEPQWLGYPVVRSAIAPTNTSVLWYDTSTGVEELFVYDSTRSKWLGADSFCIEFGRVGTINSGVGHYTKGSGNRDVNTNVGQEMGYRAPFDCTIVAWTFSTSAPTTGWTHRIGVYDDSAGSASFPHTYAPAGSYDDFTELNLNINLDAGDLVGASAINGTASIVNQNYSLVIKRRTA